MAEVEDFHPSRSPGPNADSTLPGSVLLAEELYRLIMRTKKYLWHTAARTLEARGESIFAWPVLCLLVRNGPTAQREIAYRTGQHPAGVSRLIEEIEGQKLVRRKVDPSDRRRQLVEVTAKGKAWVDSLTPPVFAAVDQAMGSMSEEERRMMRKLLLKLLESSDGSV
ncbi:MAG TPA: MarR family transcriptional regulator [Polyangiaceae bacterium]|nr:MarR family transcriptional regulator [Polyangiaceae bacterium]